jgi:hypothetical protein
MLTSAATFVPISFSLCRTFFTAETLLGPNSQGDNMQEHEKFSMESSPSE